MEEEGEEEDREGKWVVEKRNMNKKLLHRKINWEKRQYRIIGKYDKSTLYTWMKIHNESHSFLQLINAQIPKMLVKLYKIKTKENKFLSIDTIPKFLL